MRNNDDENYEVAPINTADKTEILSTADEKIKVLGELLSSDSSRSIINLLFENEMTANQIAQKTGMSIQLVKHYLVKMQEVGIVQVSRVEQNEKGRDMKYYIITKIAVIIMPSKLSEKAKKSKSLLNALTRIYRLAAIGVTSIGSWFVTHSLLVMNYPREEVTNLNNTSIANLTASQEQLRLGRSTLNVNHTLPTSFHIGGANIPFDILWPTIIAVSVIAIGLIVEIYLRMHKKSARKSHEI